MRRSILRDALRLISTFLFCQAKCAYAGDEGCRELAVYRFMRHVTCLVLRYDQRAAPTRAPADRSALLNTRCTNSGYSIFLVVYPPDILAFCFFSCFSYILFNHHPWSSHGLSSRDS